MRLTYLQRLDALTSASALRGEIKNLLLRRFWQRRKTWNQDYAGLKVNFDTSDYYSNNWFYGPKNLTVAHEPGSTRLIAHLAQRSRAFLDIGANLGYFSVIAGAANPSIAILAIEMDEYLAPLIERNAEINGLKNLVVETGAVGSGGGVRRYTPHAFSLLLNMSAEPTGGLNVEVDAPIFEIDALLAKHGMAPDLVKIDIDGSEVAALRSANGMLANPYLTMFLEIHPKLIEKMGDDIAEVEAALHDNGLRTYEIPGYRSDAEIDFNECEQLAELSGNPMLLVTRKDPETLFCGLR